MHYKHINLPLSNSLCNIISTICGIFINCSLKSYQHAKFSLKLVEFWICPYKFIFSNIMFQLINALVWVIALSSIVNLHFMN